MTTTKRCAGERDELRYDVQSGDWYETGAVLLCTEEALAGETVCQACLERRESEER